MFRRDLAQIKEAIQEQSRATHDAAEAARCKADSAKATVVSTAPDKNFVAEVLPNDPKGQATQRSIKRATWLAAWSTLAAFVAASIYAGIATEQTRLLRTANEQTKTQWEAEHRPWVGSGGIEVKKPTFLVYPNNPIQARTLVSFAIDIPIKNFGNSPAFHVDTEVDGTMTEQIAGSPTVDAMMEYACGRADANAKSVGEVLFPNGPETTLEQQSNIGVPFIQITEVHRVWVAICTAYSGTTSGQQLHHTKLWMASWPISGHPTEIRRTSQPIIIYYSLPITGWVVVKTEAD